jgi:vitamin B12 transport system substrate-binding protein
MMFSFKQPMSLIFRALVEKHHCFALKKWVITLCCFLSIVQFPVFAKESEQRIVALAPHIVESLFAIGVGDRIVATVEYADFPEAANVIPRVGGYGGIQVEKILALAPDLIIAWQSGNKQQDIEKMKALGLNVVLSEPKNIADIASELRLYGELTGHQQQAEKVASQFIAKLNMIQRKYAEANPVTVFYQLWSKPMMTINNTTWIHQGLQLCGATNVFAEAKSAYPQISIEHVIDKKPQVIIIPDEKSDTPQPDIGWQKWPMIPAVKEQAFVSVNADLIHRFSARMLTGIEDMCFKLEAHR